MLLSSHRMGDMANRSHLSLSSGSPSVKLSLEGGSQFGMSNTILLPLRIIRQQKQVCIADLIQVLLACLLACLPVSSIHFNLAQAQGRNLRASICLGIKLLGFSAALLHVEFVLVFSLLPLFFLIGVGGSSYGRSVFVRR